MHARDSAGEFHEAGIGVGTARAVRPDVRGDRICWLDAPGAPSEQPVLASLDALRLGLNRTLLLGLQTLELHYASYAAGRRYVRHLDRSPRGIERVVTVVLYLNADWGAGDGGELVISTPGGAVSVTPRGGTLVAFMSAQFEHEVRVAHRERLSITGWFSRRMASRPLA
jgi:SM-20-related protein